MPPKIEKKVEGPLRFAVNKARANIANVNNALFTKSLQGLTKRSTAENIVQSYRNRLKKKANENAAIEAAELERTGGIDLSAEIKKYATAWESYNDCRKNVHGHYILSKDHERLMNAVNKHLKGAMQFHASCTSSGRTDTETASNYGIHVIMAKIMKGDYDNKLEQLKYVLSKQRGKAISENPAGTSIHSAISIRESELQNMSAPGGGAGTAGGARRRRTHKRKTHRRKTHKRRH